MRKVLVVLFIMIIKLFGLEKIDLGVDVFFKDSKHSALNNKKIALIINQTSVNKGSGF